MINAIVYKVGQDPEIIELIGSIREFKEILGCEMLDHTSIPVEADEMSDKFEDIFGEYVWDLDMNIKSGKFVLWADDCGLLDKKPYNRGFYGNFLIVKVDNNGFDIRMSDAEIERIKAHFEEIGKEVKHQDKIVERFLKYMEEYLDPTVTVYSIEEYQIFVSVREVINDMRNITDQQTNKSLLKLAVNYFTHRISLKEVAEIFEDFKKQFAQFQYEIAVRK